MASAPPTQVRIRSYNVGFGDCFLLTFTYPRSQRNVLIDFGSTKQSKTGPSGGMLEIAEKIKEDCGGKLQILVATHRHADHISGFAGKPGKVIASLKPDLVVQPWTEDPDLDKDAKAPASSDGGGRLRARALTTRLSAMQAVAEAVLEQVPRLEASDAVSNAVANQVRFLGETNLKNAESVRNLMSMGDQNVYVNFGTKLKLGALLPGVRVDVLGPPTLEQSSAISHQADKNEDEFWHLAARALDVDGAERSPIFDGAPTSRRSTQEARWVIPQIDKMQAQEALAIVRALDDALNNTSVILLFEIGDTRLLFPGDAQIENWNYALRECDEADAIRKRLADARFYKVGHHGSLNATPKTLWNGFEHRDKKPGPERLATMVSTAAEKHGSVKSGTEVPRRVLIEELTEMSDLRNTQSLKGDEQFWHDVEFEF
ncbi:MAG TPA: hypothetical protein VFI03_11640 [Solirubrobacterales bacterium]|nr:hypothetical protein [Solirubrobacterales bacterium]